MTLPELFFSKIPKKLYRIASNVCEYFYYRFFYSTPVLKAGFARKKFFIGGRRDDPEDLAGLFRELFSTRVQPKVDEAEQILGHAIDLLGSGPVKLKAGRSSLMDQRKNSSAENYDPIDWHKDFKSGYRWNPKTFHHYVRYGHKQGVDVKVPWELSRFQYFSMLGQVYLLTKDRKYADEFQNQISDWIKNNKVGFGVNWACNMDVAIRAANWLVSQEYFYDAILPESFWRDFFTSIYEHGRFIRKHLKKKRPSKRNHFLSEIAGLFFISIYCPFFYESEEWKIFCIKALEKEIEKQVYADGCNFEGSTSYHRLVLELFFYAVLLAKRASIDFSPFYHNRLKKMFTFSLYCIKPDGKIPQIGDNDNGRFLTFSRRPTLDHTYLLSFAAIYFRDKEFKIKAFPYDEEAFWVFGKDGCQIWKHLQYRDKELCSKAFPDAGWYVMRHRDNYSFISCGPKGQNVIGGHNHNDKLSFELMLNGEDIIVDPGTYVYTPYPEWHNKFRSTAFHNTIKIDNREQSDICGDLFEMRQAVECKNCVLEESQDMIVFKGELKYLEADILHKRKIVLEKHTGTFRILDKVTSRLPCEALINLCLGNCGTNYHISLNKGVFEEVEGFYSKEYGHKRKAVFLRYKTENCTNFTKEITIRR